MPVAASATRSDRVLVIASPSTRAPTSIRPGSSCSRPSRCCRRSSRGGIRAARSSAYDLAGVDVDDDAMQHRDDRVAGQRILPCLERRMSDLGLDEEHVADLALVLLRRGDLLRVGRPEQHRAIAARPTGVVGGVAEILHAVRRELAFLAARDIANPEIPVANERGLGSVGRHHGSARRATTSAATAASASTATSSDRTSVGGRWHARAIRARGVADDPRLPRRIDEDEFGTRGAGAIPHATVGQPVGCDRSADHEAVERRGEHFHRAVIVGGGERAGRLSADWCEGDDRREGQHQSLHSKAFWETWFRRAHVAAQPHELAGR